MAVLNLNDVVHVPSGLCFLTTPLLFPSGVMNLKGSSRTLPRAAEVFGFSSIIPVARRALLPATWKFPPARVFFSNNSNEKLHLNKGFQCQKHTEKCRSRVDRAVIVWRGG